jgi:hypothetical protein
MRDQENRLTFNAQKRFWLLLLRPAGHVERGAGQTVKDAIKQGSHASNSVSREGEKL